MSQFNKKTALLTIGFFLLSQIAFNQVQIGADIDGEAAGDQSGRSVSLSSDGNTVAIGANTNDGNGANSGHVRLYEWNGTAWIQKGTDIDGEANIDQSGMSVSLSSDGNTVAIGATTNDGNGNNAGHVRLYEWNGIVWIQKGTDIDGEAANDQLGVSVSLSSDGNTVAIGGTLNDGNGANAGHVRLYEWNGAAWIQKGTDIDGEAANDYSGNSVSLSSDGNTVAIGSPLNDGAGSDAGHVRLYEWNGIAWVQKGTDIDGEAAGDQSGLRVSLSSDGNTVAIGGPLNDGIGSDAGHVRLYDWNGTAWIQKGADIDGEAAGDQSGFSVSLSSDGNTVAIGANGNDGTGSLAGHVRLYAWNGTAWIQKGTDIDGEAASDQLGSSVSLNSIGNTVAIGATGNDGTGSGAGHVRLYYMCATTGTDTITACNSYTWIDGNTYTTSNNTANFNMVGGNAAGCDSLVILNLTINNSSTSSITETVCDSYTSPSGKIFTISNTYLDTIPNLAQCDSVITINLTVNPSFNSSLPLITICDVDSALIFGTYESVGGMYYDSLQTITGCDSITSQQLIVTPGFNSSLSSITICDNDSALLFGVFESVGGMYYDSLQTLVGCDSVIAQQLIVNQTYSQSDFANICAGDIFTFHDGGTSTIDSVHTNVLTTITGCDSVIVTTLTVDVVDVVVTQNNDTLTANNTSATSYQWIDCNNGNAPISGATNQQYIAATNGNYAVVITENGCTDTSSCYTVMGVGVDEVNNPDSFNVYPNPTENDVNIEINEQVENPVVSIVDITGRVIYTKQHSKSKITISLDQQPNGIYFIQLKNQNRITTKKLVVN
jgi:hypothetical protein